MWAKMCPLIGWNNLKSMQKKSNYIWGNVHIIDNHPEHTQGTG